MSWLKRIGQILVGVLKVEAGFEPILRAQVPAAGPVFDKVDSELAQIVAIITTTEALGAALGLPGADKLRAAGPLVAQEIKQMSFMIGKEIADPVAYAKASAGIASNVADLLNSLKAPSA